MRIIFIFLLAGYFPAVAQNLIDKKATQETKSLYNNLFKISDKGFMFGHQDGDAYGVGWNAEPGRSDVKEVCGDYPAVHGWDIGRIEIKQPYNLDSVDFDKMVGWIQANYKRGGINTVSWHVDNPVTKKDSWDTTSAVKHILPGGELHLYFVGQLDLLADFLKRCKSGKTYIPIIFRPYHEHNGNWFWWGKGNVSESDYIKLWKFTIDYLRNEKQLHHLIYAFSPDRSRLNMDLLSSSYQYGYPGDDYVDLLGLDNYMDVGVKWNTKTTQQQREDFVKSLKAVSDLAKEKNKVAAITETGLESITNPAWFTEVILNPLKQNRDIKIAYVMVWRNDRPNHSYAPYPGHPAADDFKKFFNDERTVFESDLKDVYKSK
ncbi:MAG TPA: glycosyl hydrolase [Ohtaekwangia sp.]|nr:glycosyl hydrolase [Ohtaekwangia sp.]